MYRAVCLGKTHQLDADPGPYYPFVLVAHYFWRRGDVCRACVFLEKARGGGRPFHRDEDEDIATRLLEAAIREGIEGVRRVETEDSIWSWASLFKDLLIAELDPRGRADALRRIKPALKEVFEAADVPDFIAEGYNIFQPYISVMPPFNSRPDEGGARARRAVDSPGRGAGRMDAEPPPRLREV